MKSKRIIKIKMEEILNLADNKRVWHQNFVNYTESIVSDLIYEGLYFERDSNNRVKWVVTGKSEKGRERRKWWDNKCLENNINIEAGCYAKIALKIHPTKIHFCQICGKGLSIEYVYPNRRTITALKKEFDISVEPFSKDIFEIIREIVINENDIEKIKRVFKIPIHVKVSLDDYENYIRDNYVNGFAKGLLSPGAMSNSPDRLDGYHSDGACCRHESDKGRHKENLQRYGQDRRVYENWADGDWKMADRLMSYFRKHGISADHIGPISLGFCHRPKFHPMTKSENSAKNNRMSLNDVQVLLEDEKTEQVVSWHSKTIWDILKNRVITNADAIKLSDIMRKNLHYVLILFSMIDEKGYGAFLMQFLNPNYSYFDYKFEGFNPKTGKYSSVIAKKLTGQNQLNNINRYNRVAFEKLKEYRSIENRKINIWKNDNIQVELENLFALLADANDGDAKIQLEKIFSLLAELLTNENW